jgi:23S rRNA-/tRNA-specific pseudouridylate synthase
MHIRFQHVSVTAINVVRERPPAPSQHTAVVTILPKQARTHQLRVPYQHRFTAPLKPSRTIEIQNVAVGYIS